MVTNPALMMTPSVAELTEQLTKGNDKVCNLKITDLEKTTQVLFHDAILIVDIDTLNGIKIENYSVSIPHMVVSKLVNYPNPLNSKATIQWTCPQKKMEEINQILKSENITIEALVKKSFINATNITQHENIIMFTVDHFSTYSLD